MFLYMIAYSAGRQEVQEAVDSYIQGSFQNAWRGLPSHWVVNSDMKAVEVRDHLMTLVDKGDRILIALLSGMAVWHGYEPDCEDWLLRHL